jgi:hypothetical protein
VEDRAVPIPKMTAIDKSTAEERMIVSAIAMSARGIRYAMGALQGGNARHGVRGARRR